jgi:hypothetical protein
MRLCPLSRAINLKSNLEGKKGFRCIAGKRQCAMSGRQRPCVVPVLNLGCGPLTWGMGLEGCHGKPVSGPNQPSGYSCLRKVSVHIEILYRIPLQGVAIDS